MSIRGLSVAMGLTVLLCCGWASAQDAGKAIQVIVGDDGTIKVIDAKTGKVLSTEKIQRPTNDKQLDEARKALERLLQDKKRIVEAQGKRIVILQDKQIEFSPKSIKIIIGPDGKAQIVTEPPAKKPVPQPAGGIDQKLDLILKQLGDLRRDVDAIKQKLEGKKPVSIHWQMVPGSKPRKDGTIELEIVPAPAKDKKPGASGPKDGKNLDPEVLQRLDQIIEELEKKERSRRIDEIEKNKNADTKREELLEAQRQLERIIRQLEEIERKNRKDK